jgi:hypothetical protein
MPYRLIETVQHYKVEYNLFPRFDEEIYEGKRGCKTGIERKR